MIDVYIPERWALRCPNCHKETTGVSTGSFGALDCWLPCECRVYPQDRVQAIQRPIGRGSPMLTGPASAMVERLGKRWG